MDDIYLYQEKSFKEIKKINEYGEEFGYARDLQKVIEYSEWRNYRLVIEKAKIACDNSKNVVMEHFVDVNKTIDMSKGATKVIEDQMWNFLCTPKEEALCPM